MTKGNNFFNELNLTHAIILSLIIHALFVMKLQISNFNLTPKPVVDIIFKTEIVKQVVPKVIPQPLPKPKPIIKPKPIEKPKPIPKPIPEPIAEPVSEPIVEPIIEPVIEPLSESIETNEVTQISEQTPTSPNPQVVNNYSNLLRAHIAKHKKYPRIAQRRKMQGEVVIAIQIGGDGSLISKNIQKSSGHKVLDKEGMNMMEKSKPFPVPPDTLKNSVTNVVVPIAFNLI
ncbi:MAG: TonB family protein [Methylophilaceae bacterium]|nr:TonB family protein [Methylophilaceae bacterium]